MFVNNLTIENFKKFNNISIDLSSPLTFLLGPNSSGKSSIAKSLLAFKQTASNSNEHDVFSAQGDSIDLGIYKNYIYEHDIQKNLKFNFSTVRNSKYGTSNNMSISIEYCHNPANQQTKIVRLEIYENGSKIIELTKKKTRENYLLKCSEEFLKDFTKSRTAFKVINKQNTDKFIRSALKGFSAEISGKYNIELTDSINIFGNEEYFLHLSICSFISGNISNLLNYFDKSFFYLGPIRQSPSRSYSRTSHLASVGINGNNTPSVLANLQTISQSERSKNKINTNKLNQLNRWIELILPGCSIKAITMEELVKLEISDKKNSDNISDVGFGVSQILPILVQLAVMSDEELLLIEQPELHLHPRAQSKFGEILVDAIKSGRRIIIETHSEHILRSIQLAISNKTAKIHTTHKLDKNQVKIIYLQSNKDAPIKIMDINDYGEFIDEWPTGFFDESYNNSLKIIKNKMQSQINN